MFAAFTFSYHPDLRCSSVRSSCWNKHSRTPLSLSISATNQVCFWLLTLLTLISQVFCVCVFGFPLFIVPFDTVLGQIILQKKNNSHTPHILTQIIWKLSAPVSQGKRRRKGIHNRSLADHWHDESNVRADMKTSNSIKFRLVPLFKVIELCVAYPSVHVTETM